MKETARKPFRGVPFFIAGLLLTSGCAPIILMTAGAVAGYVVSRDSVTLNLDRPTEKVWSAVVEETKHQGRIKKEDHSAKRLDAVVQKSDVILTLEQLTPATVRVVIRARKHLLPQVEVAQHLAVGIARRVG